MSSRWTHAICERCWIIRDDNIEYVHGTPQIASIRRPVTVADPLAEACCFCGWPTISGIYVRHDPTDTLCGGNHREA